MAGDLLLSELYGKQIISNTGSILGKVEDIIIDFEQGRIASLLLVRSDELIRSEHTSRAFAKNSVKYERVKSVDETIIVGAELQKR
jgi:sporulation protein YlmC with PRC-barrel domain